MLKAADFRIFIAQTQLPYFEVFLKGLSADCTHLYQYAKATRLPRQISPEKEALLRHPSKSRFLIRLTFI